MTAVDCVRPRFLPERRDATPGRDLEMPVHAILVYDGGQLSLSVGRRALSRAGDPEQYTGHSSTGSGRLVDRDSREAR